VPQLNVPDDWGSYFETCSICGSRYHASEGGCGCTDDKALCTRCDEWIDDGEVQHGTCETCRVCGECGESDEDELTYYEASDDWYCLTCAIAEGSVDAVTALASVAPWVEQDQP
jgi:hypothetical protein